MIQYNWKQKEINPVISRFCRFLTLGLSNPCSVTQRHKQQRTCSVKVGCLWADTLKCHRNEFETIEIIINVVIIVVLKSFLNSP